MSKFLNFYEWLAKQKNQRTPVGKLAGEVLHDPSFPKDVASLDALLTHLQAKEATGVTLATARVAWKAYARGQK